MYLSHSSKSRHTNIVLVDSYVQRTYMYHVCEIDSWFGASEYLNCEYANLLPYSHSFGILLTVPVTVLMSSREVYECGDWLVGLLIWFVFQIIDDLHNIHSIRYEYTYMYNSRTRECLTIDEFLLEFVANIRINYHVYIWSLQCTSVLSSLQIYISTMGDNSQAYICSWYC
jgi:hypothetical protein